MIVQLPLTTERSLANNILEIFKSDKELSEGASLTRSRGQVEKHEECEQFKHEEQRLETLIKRVPVGGSFQIEVLFAATHLLIKRSDPERYDKEVEVSKAVVTVFKMDNTVVISSELSPIKQYISWKGYNNLGPDQHVLSLNIICLWPQAMKSLNVALKHNKLPIFSNSLFHKYIFARQSCFLLLETKSIGLIWPGGIFLKEGRFSEEYSFMERLEKVKWTLPVVLQALDIKLPTKNGTNLSIHDERVCQALTISALTRGGGSFDR